MKNNDTNWTIHHKPQLFEGKWLNATTDAHGMMLKKEYFDTEHEAQEAWEKAFNSSIELAMKEGKGKRK